MEAKGRCCNPTGKPPTPVGSQLLSELRNIWGSFSNGSKPANPEVYNPSSNPFFLPCLSLGTLAPVWHLLSQKHEDRGLSESHFRCLSLKFWQRLKYCSQVTRLFTGISPTIKKKIHYLQPPQPSAQITKATHLRLWAASGLLKFSEILFSKRQQALPTTRTCLWRLHSHRPFLISLVLLTYIRETVGFFSVCATSSKCIQAILLNSGQFRYCKWKLGHDYCH